MSNHGMRDDDPINECKDYEARRKQMETKKAAEKLNDIFMSSEAAQDILNWGNENTNSVPEGITLEYDNEDELVNLVGNVVRWHYDRNLIDGSTDKDQTLKLLQELGELSDSVCKGKDVRDDIGDMLVVLINIAERNDLALSDCLERAWQDIKDRKGKMIDGIFVKEADL